MHTHTAPSATYMCRHDKCVLNFKVYKVNVKTFYQKQREIAVKKSCFDYLPPGVICW